MKAVHDSRLLELDALRGLAAFAVVIYHYTNGYEWFFGHPNLENYPLLNSYIHLYIRVGLYAVQLFFILSGFVILNSLERSKRGRDFLFNRFSRLYPPYWAAIFLTVLLSFALGFSPFNESPPMLMLLSNLTMLQNLLDIENIDPVYWTLKIELLFYLIMFSFRQLKLMRWIDYCVLSWLSILILEKRHLFLSHLLSLFGIAYAPTEPVRIMAQPLVNDGFNALAVIQPAHFASILNSVNNYTIAIKDFIKNDLILLSGSSFGDPQCQAHLFIIGIVLYQIHKHGANWKHYLSLVICCVLQWLTPFPSDSFINTPIVMLMILLFLGIIKGYLRFLAYKPFVYLGAISYSLYLTHQMIGYRLMSKLYLIFDNPYVNIILVTVFAVGLAALFTHYIEQPSLQWLRGWYKHRYGATTR